MTARGTILSSTYTTTDFYVEACCSCGVLFAMPLHLRKQRRQDRTSFYCPNGHSQSYTGKTDAELLAEQRALTERLGAEAEALRRSNAALRGHLTRRERAAQ